MMYVLIKTEDRKVPLYYSVLRDGTHSFTGNFKDAHIFDSLVKAKNVLSRTHDATILVIKMEKLSTQNLNDMTVKVSKKIASLQEELSEEELEYMKELLK